MTTPVRNDRQPLPHAAPGRAAVSGRTLPTWRSLALALAAASWAATASAAPPTTVLFEGVLTAAGGPIVDGAYPLTVRIYATAGAKDPLWTEAHGKVAVAGGRFALALGATTPLDLPALATASALHLGVQVPPEAELPRQPLHAGLFALHAATAGHAATAKQAEAAKVAAGLACTGCVGVAALKFDGDLDLGGQSLKAKNATFTGDLVAKTVTAAALVGDGSKITGLALPAGACPEGQVVVAIGKDGALQCKPTPAAKLPADGIAAVSNGVLSNDFVEAAATAGPTVIPDNTGASASVTLTLPPVGDAKALSLTVELQNSDLATVAIVVLPPDDKKVGWVLCDPCGAADAKAYKATFDAKNPPKTGDIAGWIGKDPGGAWTFKVTDTSFCILQKPGNAALCDLGKAIDGALLAAKVEATATSASKIEAKGAFLASGGFRFPLLAKAPFACDAAHLGYSYFDTTAGKLFFCQDFWRVVLMQACGNGLLEPGEACDEGIKNSDSTADACRLACVKAKCGDKVKDAGEACDDGNLDDSDGCRKDCTLPCDGWAYKGICLKANNLNGNQDAIPSGCKPYQPQTGWQKADFVAICEHFMDGGTNCSTLDTDADGGLCSNFQAIASWESNGTPDIWLRSGTFNFTWINGSPQCNLYSGTGKVVYACQ